MFNVEVIAKYTICFVLVTNFGITYFRSHKFCNVIFITIVILLNLVVNKMKDPAIPITFITTKFLQENRLDSKKKNGDRLTMNLGEPQI